MDYIPADIKRGAEQRMEGHDELDREQRLQHYSNNGGLGERDPTWNKPLKQARERYTLTPAQLRRMGIIDK